MEPSSAAWHRALTVAALAVYGLAIYSVARSAARDPEWNFDAIPYVSIALSLGDGDIERVHHRVYEELRAAAQPKVFDALTGPGAYRQALYTSPTALATQRGLYVNKPAYVALIAGLHAAGMNAFWATRAISVAAYVALALVVLVWLRTTASGPAHVVAAALLLASRPMSELALFSTPDCVGIVPLVVGAWLILGRGAYRPGLAVASSAIALRPDAAVMVLLMAAWATFFAPGARLSRRAFVLTSILVVIGTVALQKAVGAVSTRVLLHHVFEARIYTPQQLGDAMPWSHYWTVVEMGLDGYMLYHPSDIALHLLVSTVAVVAVVVFRRAAAREVVAWMLLMWGYTVIHFLVLPDRSDRYFAPTYLLAGLGAIGYALRMPAAASPPR